MTKRRVARGRKRSVTRTVTRRVTWCLVIGCACMAAPQRTDAQSGPDYAPQISGGGYIPPQPQAIPTAPPPAAAPAAPSNAPPVLKSGEAAPVSRDQPVAFTADHFEYDRTAGIVTASGHVEAWQNDHLLRADKVTFDRNTNVAAAQGNVVLVEPDGQVLFSDYAELTQGMREGVLRDMRSLLAQNGKLAANGARRTDGAINELTHAVYTTCNLCKDDPKKPPLWQLRAYSAVQDVQNKRIEYQDAILDVAGVPVFYMPYFSHPDPSEKRASGFLTPTFGSNTHIGAFLDTPYFWAIDPQRDLTIHPLITSTFGPQLSGEYREKFNDGTVRINAGSAYDNGMQGYVFATGRFTYDDTWRYGFDVNRTTSTNYLRDFQVQNYSAVLSTSAYVEGFGAGAYSKLSVNLFQGAATTIDQSKLPYVLPRYEYSYFGEPDSLGGRLRIDTTEFNVVRENGNNTQRAGVSLEWDRPFTGDLGELYKLIFHADAAAYTATDLRLQPTYADVASTETARAQPTVGVEFHWPFMRDGGKSGTQIIEPIVQLLGSPNSGRFLQSRVPNEDSLDLDFSDANLFSINRFPGIDRTEGGMRANVGIHGNWTIGTGSVDTLVGQSYREHTDDSMPLLSGLNKRMSDLVARVTVSPSSYADLTARTRINPRNGNVNFVDAIASAGVPMLRLNAGYLYSNTNPYFLYDQSPLSVQPTGYPASYFTPRNEVTVGASSQFSNYKFSGYVKRDIQLSKMVAVGGRATYENECLIFDVNLYKRYTSIEGDTGSTTILFEITLKTVGQFGFHAS
jgi:LPS-assembly protein